jgi:hypothetical protein
VSSDRVGKSRQAISGWEVEEDIPVFTQNTFQGRPLHFCGRGCLIHSFREQNHVRTYQPAPRQAWSPGIQVPLRATMQNYNSCSQVAPDMPGDAGRASRGLNLHARITTGPSHGRPIGRGRHSRSRSRSRRRSIGRGRGRGRRHGRGGGRRCGRCRLHDLLRGCVARPRASAWGVGLRSSARCPQPANGPRMCET